VGGLSRASGAFASAFLDDVAGFDNPPSVISSTVPDAVVVPVFYPFNWATRNIGQLTTDVRWNSADGTVHRVGPDGHLVPVTFRQVVELPLLESAIVGPGAELTGDRCVTFTNSAATVRALLASPARGTMAVRLVGTISQDTAVSIRAVVDGGAVESLNGDETVWTEGDVDVALPTSLEQLAGVELGGFRPGSELCLSAASIVEVVDAT
jgi:hypothetical protein